jgi:hypothetical protein
MLPVFAILNKLDIFNAGIDIIVEYMYTLNKLNDYLKLAK